VIKKILVIRFSSLGDIVMSTPLIRCLRCAYPDAQIDMVVRSDFMDLIRDNPHISSKIGLDRKSGLKGLFDLRRRINSEHYDLIYDAHRSLRTVLLMPFLKSDRKAYFKKYYIRRDLSLLLKVNLMRNTKRFLERYIEPLNRYGVFYDGQGPELFLSQETQNSGLSKVNFNGNGLPWVGFIPSAQWPGKRWAPSKFRELVIRVMNETACGIVVFGGKNDVFCKDICKDLDPSRVVNTQGLLTIGESAAVLRQCKFVVANDTGLMHVADALGVPSVLVLGPTSEELGCIPFHPLTQIVQKDLWCRPCSKNGQAPCIRGKRECLEAITAGEVFDAFTHVLEELPG
jgi:heptosyltransferase II